MKILILAIFLLSFNAVQAQDLDFKCVHLVQKSHNDQLSHETYAFVTESMPCPPPHGSGGIQILFNSELKEAQPSHKTNNSSHQLNDSTPVQENNEIDKTSHSHGGNKDSMLHMVTEPECIWFKRPV